MDDPKLVQWLYENLRDARMSLTNAKLVLEHARNKGDRIAHLFPIIDAQLRAIRSLECLLFDRLQLEDSNPPIPTQGD